MAARERGAERSYESGWTVEPRQICGKKRGANLCAGLITDDRGGQKCCAGQFRSLRQCEQSGPDHNTMVADAGGVHILAYQAVAERRIGEGRIAWCRELAGPDDGCAAFDGARDPDRLTAPWVVLCLERTGEKIQQADFRLGDDIRIETPGIDRKRCARQLSRQRRLAWSDRPDRHCNRPLLDWRVNLAAHFHPGPFLKDFRDRREVG